MIKKSVWSASALLHIFRPRFGSCSRTRPLAPAKKSEEPPRPIHDFLTTPGIQ